ncbi:fructokinase/branched chain amino acid--2-keto-4-methylthiobutyrate aminotransferase, partial [Enterococcus faecium]|nr:fructokinase/branched chain amino acid--2-keto-4-methylthiobutyrate aminotransferase [Enterococcus faecium]MCZ1468540.1 fructokinase/branched chain amino acid--2-keto-4-methylthiobutyrate aminotransferase [Enterococcus faecium]
TVTLIPNGIHHPPIEDGRLLPNSVKNNGSATLGNFALGLNQLQE